MDIQLAFNKYKTVTYMCQYFSRTKDQCSQAMKEEVKKAVQNNMCHHETMKTMAKAYLNNRECSVQESLCYILSELKPRRIFLAIYFVNTSYSEERVQVLLLETERSKLPDDNSNIFKKSLIKKSFDGFMERSSAAFFNGEYSVSDNFFKTECLAYCIFERNYVRLVNIRVKCKAQSKMKPSISDAIIKFYL